MFSIFNASPQNLARLEAAGHKLYDDNKKKLASLFTDLQTHATEATQPADVPVG